MSTEQKIRTLSSEINKGIEVLEKIGSRLDGLLEGAAQEQDLHALAVTQLLFAAKPNRYFGFDPGGITDRSTGSKIRVFRYATRERQPLRGRTHGPMRSLQGSTFRGPACGPPLYDV